MLWGFELKPAVSWMRGETNPHIYLIIYPYKLQESGTVDP